MARRRTRPRAEANRSACIAVARRACLFEGSEVVMKLNLVVMTPGKMEGKNIPVTLAQFLVGRDPQCQLRPASALISKRHCAILIREEKAFIRDFDSTNGTSLNDELVKGEAELHDGDSVKIGPLAFRVALEAAVPVD